jgi:DNA-binding response OmpR family regulator
MTRQPDKILIIEDEPQYRFLLQLNLEASGYQVVLAEDGLAGLEMVVREEPDLILLDIMLPNMNGYELCQQVRQFSTVPIIMITARAGQKNIVAGLNAGADDYITKPFSADEMMARIQATLRRREMDQKSEAGSIIHTGDLIFDRSRQRVYLGGVEVQLTNIEYRLLDELGRNHGHVVSAAHLLEAVWGPGYEEATKLLRQSIYRLRHKIEHDPASPQHLLNRAGQGYILVNAKPHSARSLPD